MKIVSWNVNGIRSCAQKGLFSYLRRVDPDVFCLQETKAHPDVLGDDLLHPEGRHSYWSSAQRAGYSGTVTFTRDEPMSVETGIGIRKFDTEGRFVITDLGDFIVYNVYFPNGGMGPERQQFKMEFLVHFLEHLQERVAEGREIVLVGDYNVAYLDEDVYDPIGLSTASGFLPEERQWFWEFLAAGFVDCFRTLHPQAINRFTWWSYRDGGRITNRGWRIDHICVTEKLARRIKSCDIHDDVMGSDHCPIYLELK